MLLSEHSKETVDKKHGVTRTPSVAEADPQAGRCQ